MVNEQGEVLQQPQQHRNQLGITTDHFNGLFVQLQQQRQQIEAAVERFETKITTITKHYNNMMAVTNRNINRIAIQPPRMAGVNEQQYNNDQMEFDGINRPAVLSRCPRTVFDLWTEYQHGLAGNKAAKDFTTKERGRCKGIYCRRKSVWDIIDRMIRSGAQYTAATAIDRIYQCYGRRLSVTQIIDAIIADKSNGGHPNLR